MKTLCIQLMKLLKLPDLYSVSTLSWVRVYKRSQQIWSAPSADRSRPLRRSVGEMSGGSPAVLRWQWRWLINKFYPSSNFVSDPDVASGRTSDGPPAANRAFMPDHEPTMAAGRPPDITYWEWGGSGCVYKYEYTSFSWIGVQHFALAPMQYFQNLRVWV